MLPESDFDYSEPGYLRAREQLPAPGYTVTGGVPSYPTQGMLVEAGILHEGDHDETGGPGLLIPHAAPIVRVNATGEAEERGVVYGASLAVGTHVLVSGPKASGRTAKALLPLALSAVASGLGLLYLANGAASQDARRLLQAASELVGHEYHALAHISAGSPRAYEVAFGRSSNIWVEAGSASETAELLELALAAAKPSLIVVHDISALCELKSPAKFLEQAADVGIRVCVRLGALQAIKRTFRDPEEVLEQFPTQIFLPGCMDAEWVAGRSGVCHAHLTAPDGGYGLVQRTTLLPQEIANSPQHFLMGGAATIVAAARGLVFQAFIFPLGQFASRGTEMIAARARQICQEEKKLVLQREAERKEFVAQLQELTPLLARDATEAAREWWERFVEQYRDVPEMIVQLAERAVKMGANLDDVVLAARSLREGRGTIDDLLDILEKQMRGGVEPINHGERPRFTMYRSGDTVPETGVYLFAGLDHSGPNDGGVVTATEEAESDCVRLVQGRKFPVVRGQPCYWVRIDG